MIVSVFSSSRPAAVRLAGALCIALALAVPALAAEEKAVEAAPAAQSSSSAPAAPVSPSVSTPVPASTADPATAPASSPATAPASAPATAPASSPATAPAPSPATAPATAPIPSPSSVPVVEASAPPAFQVSDVENKARELAEKPYENPDAQVSEFIKSIQAAQWASIRFRPERALWKSDAQPFEARLYHPGFLYNRMTPVHVVDGPRDVTVPFSPDMFQYPDEGMAEKARKAGLNFAGFGLLYPLNRPDTKDEIVTFLGASYFRSFGKQALPGVSARGLAVNTASATGEEHPYFREFWLVKPKAGAETFTLYALMDSPSVTGAYTFVVTPGASVIMDVDCKLFPRKGVSRPLKVGLAPLSSMFLFSETAGGFPGDWRPEVHESDGLLFVDSARNWSWRPLNNPSRLNDNVFGLDNPRGFGLIQRDDDFDHYMDFTARYERRSSLWVEPKGDWGTGRLELIEIPSKEEIHSNIVAFWVPDKGWAAESDPDGAPLAFSYRLYWTVPGFTPHELGRVAFTRVARPAKNEVRFVVDFESSALRSVPADTGLTSVIELPSGVSLLDRQLVKNAVTGGWRLSFRVRLPDEGVIQNILNMRDGSPGLRFRALIKKGENLPDLLTEIWTYDLSL